MKFINLYNFFAGTVVVLAADLLSDYGTVLSGFLLLNLIDWITGTLKARFLKKESSVAGLKGILKKLGYWIIILVAFTIGHYMAVMGEALGFVFRFAPYLGWLTLGMLLTNEARSILENLTEMGVTVPEFLIKGLAVCQNSLDDKFPSGGKEK